MAVPSTRELLKKLVAELPETSGYTTSDIGVM